MATVTSVVSGFFATFLIFSYWATGQKIDFSRRRCDCPIPGTELYTDIFYEMRFSAGPNAGDPLTYSSWTHIELKYHRLVAVDLSKNNTFVKGVPLPPSMHWGFVETEIPGWYHLQNKNHPDKYITWGVEREDKLYGDAWRLVLEPNYPGKHESRMDFFVRPYRPQGVGIYVHQLKFKSRPMAQVSLSSYAGRYDEVPIQLYLGESDLIHYEYGHSWFHETIFDFHKVNETETATSSTSCNATVSWSLLLLMYSVAGTV